MNNEIAVGLDIGTTKVCAIVAAPDENSPGKLSILGIGRTIFFACALCGS